MGPFALAAQLGVPRAEAKEFIAAYFDRFPKIRACLDAILEKARATGGTETIFGRVRPIPGLHDRNHAVRANAERMAMNAPFQGSAADLDQEGDDRARRRARRASSRGAAPPPGPRRARPRVRRGGPRRRGRGPRAADDGGRRVRSPSRSRSTSGAARTGPRRSERAGRRALESACPMRRLSPLVLRPRARARPRRGALLRARYGGPPARRGAARSPAPARSPEVAVRASALPRARGAAEASSSARTPSTSRRASRLGIVGEASSRPGR